MPVTLREMRMLLVSRRLPLSGRGLSSAQQHMHPAAAHEARRTTSPEGSDSEASELHAPPQAAAPAGAASPHDADGSEQGARSAGNPADVPDTQPGGGTAPAGSSAPGGADTQGDAHEDALPEGDGSAGSDASSKEWAAAQAAQPRHVAKSAAAAGGNTPWAGAADATHSGTKLAALASTGAAVELHVIVQPQAAPVSPGRKRRPQAAAQRAPWGRRNPYASPTGSHGVQHAAWRDGGQPARAAIHPSPARPRSVMALAPERLPPLGASRALSPGEHEAQAARGRQTASTAAMVQASGTDVATGDTKSRLQGLHGQDFITNLARMTSPSGTTPSIGPGPVPSLPPELASLLHTGRQPHAGCARRRSDSQLTLHAAASRNRAAAPDPGPPSLGSWQAGMQPVPALSGLWLSRPGTPVQ